MQNLVIVESPTKARTLQKFLGDKYAIEASMGHIRDLPKGDLGVDIKNNFEPQYVIPRDKRKRVNELKKMAQSAQTVYLASDPDREGEAIAWHISELLGNSQVKSSTASGPEGKSLEIKRVVFHEITESAIKDAFLHPRDLDLKLVDAQQGRRILDRLVGYKLSPLLWQKIKKGLSAGRVQSVALRLIVEREREVLAFKADEYWSIEATVKKEEGKEGEVFIANLIEKDGSKLEIKNEADAKIHVGNLEKAKFLVSKITKKEAKRFPYPPFTTSTLQQASANKLGMSAKKTMMVAQALYEQGFITYMRTDSVNLALTAINAVRIYIENFIGKSYLPTTARVFKSKSKNAQEAHEAIRPTNANLQSLDIKQHAGFNRDHIRLYDLIWKRFVACQMNEAVMDQTAVDVTAGSYLLRANGSVIKFEGWLKLYGKEAEEVESEKDEVDVAKQKQVLPDLQENQNLDLLQLSPNQHFTEASPRYNEASLIKKLEELGIGRPSTYAPTLSTIQDRFYVEKIERKFIPTNLGMTVCDFLVTNFAEIVDYSFTAQMEESLDEVARGERQWQPLMREFFDPFEKKLEKVSETVEKVKMEVELANKQCPVCGKELIVRVGKFGKFFACSGFPECKHTESMEEKINAKCPNDNGDVVSRKTRKGKTFYGCKNWPVCKFASWNKPKNDAEPEKPLVTS